MHDDACCASRGGQAQDIVGTLNVIHTRCVMRSGLKVTALQNRKSLDLKIRDQLHVKISVKFSQEDQWTDA